MCSTGIVVVLTTTTTSFLGYYMDILNLVFFKTRISVDVMLLIQYRFINKTITQKIHRKIRSEPRCSGRVGSSCFLSNIFCVIHSQVWKLSTIFHIYTYRSIAMKLDDGQQCKRKTDRLQIMKIAHEAHQIK